MPDLDLADLSHDFDDCPIDCIEAGETIAQALADAGLLVGTTGATRDGAESPDP